MRHRSLTTVLLVSVLMLASAGPANALFDIGGVIQRAQMIVNQATQIANQIRQMRTMTRQLTELEEQLDYMKEAARGEVDALIEPFAELAAGSIGLVGDDLDWGSEFSGAAGELVDAVRGMGSGDSFTDVWRSAQGVADQVSEADILELFRNRPAEASSRAVEDYRQAREAADRQRVLDYAMMDAAASLASTVESAQGSFDDLTANGNLSNASVSHCAHWLIGLEASDMPPELPHNRIRIQRPPSASTAMLHGGANVSATRVPAARGRGFRPTRGRPLRDRLPPARSSSHGGLATPS